MEITTTEDYENPWVFNDQPFTDEQIGKYVGFVYLITNKLTGERYIGRKYFTKIRAKKGKSRRVRSPSDWKDYYSSSAKIKALVEEHGPNIFERRILSLHTTRGDCNYEEVKQQFLYNVLEEDGWLNDNINGKWKKIRKHISEGRVYGTSNTGAIDSRVHSSDSA